MIRRLLGGTGLLLPVKRAFYAVETKLHLPRSRALFSHLCGPGSLVFDVGANLGQKTAIFASLNARVVSIEPEARCCEYLRKRFGSTPGITVVNAAVSDRAGRLRLFVDPQTPEISTLDATWLSDGPDSRKAGRIAEQWVEVVTLAQLIDRFGRPDYVKIDVEGSETQVLRGLTVAVPALSFEFHAGRLDELVERRDLVATLGPYEFNYTLANSYALGLAAWVSADELLPALRAHPASRRSGAVWGDVFARLPRR